MVGDVGADRQIATRHAAHVVGELAGGDAFGEITATAGFEQGQRIVAGGERRQADDAQARVDGEQFARYTDAVLLADFHVEQHDVDALFGDEMSRGRAAVAAADHVYGRVAAQTMNKKLSDEFVIVHHVDAVGRR